MKRARLALFALSFAGALRADPVTFFSPRAGESLAAGQVVTVRFGGLPKDVEEFELLLVAGSGRPLSLRLTERLDPRTRSFVWRVPNLALAEARLVLRMDQDEREVESAPSESFSIESSGARALAPLALRDGEIWILGEKDRPDTDDGLPLAGVGDASSRLSRVAVAAALLPPPLGAGLSEPDLRTVSVDCARHGGALISRGFLRSRAPRSVPQRV